MAYDNVLADRLRECLQDVAHLSEMRMFGGLAFLVGGNMAVSASGQGGLLLRVDPAQTDALAAKPHAERAVMRGRAMDGWLHVDVGGISTDAALRRWVTLGVRCAQSLPTK